MAPKEKCGGKWQPRKLKLIARLSTFRGYNFGGSLLLVTGDPKVVILSCVLNGKFLLEIRTFAGMISVLNLFFK